MLGEDHWQSNQKCLRVALGSLSPIKSIKQTYKTYWKEVKFDYGNIETEPKLRKTLARYRLNEASCCLERTHYVHFAAKESWRHY